MVKFVITIGYFPYNTFSIWGVKVIPLSETFNKEIKTLLRFH